MKKYNKLDCPVQLYNCKATVSKKGLVSYNTQIVELNNENITMHLVHTNTTMQHVRKYIKYLKEQRQNDIANKVEALYRACIDHKAQYAKYNGIDGTFEVEV